MELLAHALLPVANETDARKTARAFEAYDPDQVTVLYVVKKGDGAPAKTPVGHSETVGSAAFEAARSVVPDATTETVYAGGVVEAIFEAAREHDASAIVYRPREGGRLAQFLSGDQSVKLVTGAPVPVVALPR